MAMNPSQGSKTRGGKTSLAEINVTPLVDVMLVLLIVFMVSAPLLQQGVEVNLPKASAGSLPQSEDPIVLSIRRDQSIVLNQKNYAISTLSTKLAELASSKPNSQILVQADQAVSYGLVAKVMAELKKMRFTRVGLVTDSEK